MTDSITLRPCPFCGSRHVERNVLPNGAAYYINCKSCGAFVSFKGKESKTGTERRWNRRV